jgi:transcriptional regulator with XRE-family HTH domain
MQEEELRTLRAEFARSLTRKTNAAVGLNVAILRKRHGITQAELGSALATTLGEPMTPQVISYVENGRRELSPLELLAFAAALGEPAFRLLLVTEGDEIPTYAGDWDAERVREVVLGDDPTSVLPLSLVEEDESSTLEDMRTSLRERMAVIEVPPEEAKEQLLAEHHDSGGEVVGSTQKKGRRSSPRPAGTPKRGQR